MLTRKSILSAALLSSLALPVFADGGAALGHGEASYLNHPLGPSTTSRAEVERQRDAWARKPITSSGWKEVGGEAGWLYVGSNAPRDPRQRAVALSAGGDGWVDVGGEAGWVYVGETQRQTVASSAHR